MGGTHMGGDPDHQNAVTSFSSSSSQLCGTLFLVAKNVYILKDEKNGEKSLQGVLV